MIHPFLRFNTILHREFTTPLYLFVFLFHRIRTNCTPTRPYILVHECYPECLFHCNVTVKFHFLNRDAYRHFSHCLLLHLSTDDTFPFSNSSSPETYLNLRQVFLCSGWSPEPYWTVQNSPSTVDDTTLTYIHHCRPCPLLWSRSSLHSSQWKTYVKFLSRSPNTTLTSFSISYSRS